MAEAADMGGAGRVYGAGVIGCGYWGPNLVRNFFESARFEMLAAADPRPDRLKALARRYPSVRTFPDSAGILEDPRIELVAIATPVATHYDLAMAAVEAGKHVLIEKPMTDSLNKARRLRDAAARKGLRLMVDHTFLFTGAVRAIKSLVDSGELGEIYYVDSTRINLGLFQHDVNVMWDLAPHDLSIVNHILGKLPQEVSAVAACHFDTCMENIGYLTMRYDGDRTLVHIHSNWLSPVKVRRMLIGGSRKMVVYDDVEPTEKVKVYDAGVDIRVPPEQASDPAVTRRLRVEYRRGDVVAPKIDHTEALAVECDYIASVLDDPAILPINGAEAGMAVVAILEAAKASLAAGGAFRPVERP